MSSINNIIHRAKDWKITEAAKRKIATVGMFQVEMEKSKTQKRYYCTITRFTRLTYGT